MLDGFGKQKFSGFLKRIEKFDDKIANIVELQSKIQVNWDILSNGCVFLRKHELPRNYLNDLI